jgi:hypothetical protein
VLDDPALVLQAVDLERAGERIDEPQVADPLARVDTHLASTVERAGRRRYDLAQPIGRDREGRHVR